MKKILLLGVLLCTMSLAVFAQESEQKDAAQPKSQDVENIKLGNQLAKYGYDTKSAISLAEAARIISRIQTHGMTDQQVERGAAAASTDSKQATIDYDPKTLLADAKKFANNDPHVLAIVEQAEKDVTAASQTASRGRVNGPATDVSTVAANSYVYYTVNFRAGELAECAVIGDGDTDLDVYVYDQNNNLITKDIDYTDNCYVSWTPRWTGAFKIKIVNRGNVYNRYIIAVN